MKVYIVNCCTAEDFDAMCDDWKHAAPDSVEEAALPVVLGINQTLEGALVEGRREADEQHMEYDEPSPLAPWGEPKEFKTEHMINKRWSQDRLYEDGELYATVVVVERELGL